MMIVEPSVEVLRSESGATMLRRIELAGRTAYKSESAMTDDSAEKFVGMLIARGHLSVIEHASISARVVCDRGVSHELVRHRIASYTQESTRYCNYSKHRFGAELSFVLPHFLRDLPDGDRKAAAWRAAMECAEQRYLELLELGAAPQEARSVLPNSLKTELVMTMNLREWRSFLELRTHPSSHPDMRVVAGLLLGQLQKHVPVVFDEIARRQQSRD